MSGRVQLDAFGCVADPVGEQFGVVMQVAERVIYGVLGSGAVEVHDGEQHAAVIGRLGSDSVRAFAAAKEHLTPRTRFT